MENSRVPELDTFRGFAVLFIALSNLPLILSSANAVQSAPSIRQDLSAEQLFMWIWLTFVPAGLVGVVYFAFLMGVGIGVAAKGKPPGGVRTRTRQRGALLLFLGLCHGLLLWWGDVLFVYGLVLLLVAHWLPKDRGTRRTVAGLSVSMPIALLVVDSVSRFPFVAADVSEQLMASIVETFEDELASSLIYSSRDLSQIARLRVQDWADFNADMVFFGGPMILGAVLVGYEIGLSHLDRAIKNLDDRSGAALASFVVYSLLLVSYTAVRWVDPLEFSGWFSAAELLRIGSIPFAIHGFSFLFARLHTLEAVRNSVGLIGRASLSAYLSISVLGTLLSYGMGLHDKLGLIGSIATSLVVNVVLLVFAHRRSSDWEGPVEAGIVWFFSRQQKGIANDGKSNSKSTVNRATS